MEDVKRKRLLLVYDLYDPDPSPSAHVLRPLLEAARDRGSEVHVLCAATSWRDAGDETRDGFRFHRVRNPHYLLHAAWVRHGKVGALSSPVVFATRIARKALEVLGRYGADLDGYKRFFYGGALRRAARRVVRACGIDTVLTASLPFSTHRAGQALKRGDSALRWVALELDPYALNHFATDGREAARTRWEEETLADADGIVSFRAVFVENVCRGHRKDLADRTTWMHDPNLCVGAADGGPAESGFDPDRLNLVYSGQFYEKYRSPRRLLEFLSRPETEDVVLHLYGAEHDRLVAAHPGIAARLVAHGRVTKAESDCALRSAVAIVVVGNDVPNMTPSKVSESMSTGRPILYFAPTDADPALEALSAYGHAFVVRMDRPLDDEAVQAALAFCRANRGVVLSGAEIRRRMGERMSETVCERFLDRVEATPVRGRPAW